MKLFAVSSKEVKVFVKASSRWDEGCVVMKPVIEAKSVEPDMLIEGFF